MLRDNLSLCSKVSESASNGCCESRSGIYGFVAEALTVELKKLKSCHRISGYGHTLYWTTYRDNYYVVSVKETQYIYDSLHSKTFDTIMESSSETMKNRANVALFSSMGLGHLIPFVELARRLATNHDCAVTFITLKLDSASRQSAVLQTLRDVGDTIRVIEIADVEYDSIVSEKTKRPETKVSAIAEKTKPSLEATLRALPEPPQALIIDFFCTSLIDAANNVGVPSYLFFSSAATSLAVFHAIPGITAGMEESVSFKDCDHLLHINGVPPVHTKDVPEPFLDRHTENFRWFMYHIGRLPDFHGILINTFSDLETDALGALNVPNQPPLPPILTVGPVIVTDSTEQKDRAECLRWLDAQPPGSVVYVSFGSGATFSKEQVAEIAEGLRESGQRFLWVVRRPVSEDDAASSYISSSRSELTGFLPHGFVETTKDVGMVVPDWAPQTSILGHRSVGAFLSHGGWNSTLESIWNGMPVIVWPVFAEQRLNRMVIVDVVGVGIRVVMNEETGFVERKEVERCVREIMEGDKGKKAREKVADLSRKSRCAVAAGGSSYEAITEIVGKWRT